MTLRYLAAGLVVVAGASVAAAMFSSGFTNESLLPVLSTVLGAVYCRAHSRTAKKKFDPCPGLPYLRLLPLAFCPARRSY